MVNNRPSTHNPSQKQQQQQKQISSEDKRRQTEKCRRIMATERIWLKFRTRPAAGRPGSPLKKLIRFKSFIGRIVLGSIINRYLLHVCVADALSISFPGEERRRKQPAVANHYAPPDGFSRHGKLSSSSAWQLLILASLLLGFFRLKCLFFKEGFVRLHCGYILFYYFSR